MKSIIKFAITFISLLAFSATSAVAFETPSFPRCPSPGGTLRSQYSEGIHGIPGDLSTYTGSDSVFSIDSIKVVQCFCSPNGSGIQTNWWKLSSLDLEDVDYLKNLGWIFVPNGSVWGLEDSAYVAKNFSTSCSGSEGSSGSTSESSGSVAGVSMASSAVFCTATKPATPELTSVLRVGSKATVSWRKVAYASHYIIEYGIEAGKYIYSVPNTGNVSTFVVGSLDPNKTYFFQVKAVNDCMPGDPSGNPRSSSVGGGEVLGASTTGISTALTGNGKQIIFASGIGTILLGLALLSKNKKSDTK